MKCNKLKMLSLVGFVFGIAGNANAALIGGPDIIPAPASVADDGAAENDHQQAFNEAQCVTLTADVAVDPGLSGGLITTGTVVSSHMIFLNTPVGTDTTADVCRVWTFDGRILGVMSDTPGDREAASNVVLGAPGTTYPGAFGARGLEGNAGNCNAGTDSYVVTMNAIRVTMRVTEPGDWIRVVTACCVPVADPDVRTQGFWKRQCKGPHSSGEHAKLPMYVDRVSRFGVFTNVATPADLCDRLNPNPKQDKCEQAEAQFMALLLNIRSGRVKFCNCVADPDLGQTTVGLAVTFINAVLSNQDRTVEDCVLAQAIADDINNGVTLVACAPPCPVSDRIIDADGTATAGNGIPGAVNVKCGDPLAPFPVTGAADAGVDWFDNDSNGQWTFGLNGDDLHSEDTRTCPGAIRDGDHDLDFDCKILDLDNSLFDGQGVDCDLEVNFPFVEPHLSNGGCPSTLNNIRYHDANGDGSWDDGEDIVLDANGNGIFD